MHHYATWNGRRFISALLFACLALAPLGCTTFPIRGHQVWRALKANSPAGPPVESPGFTLALDASLGVTAHPDTPVKLLQNGDETYPVMLELIAAAQRRISLETYIVGKDQITDQIFQALRDAAQRGVEVRLLVDAAGYDRGVIADMSEMKSPNLQARVFNPFLMSWTVIRGNNRDHRKILVVDGHYAILGGINLSATQQGDGVSGWRDTALLATGPVASDAEKIFAETWEQAGRGWLGKNLPVTILNPVKKTIDTPLLRLRQVLTGQTLFTPPDYVTPTGSDFFPPDFYTSLSATARAIGSSPDAGSSATYDLYLQSILGARERLDAAFAYFVPTQAMRQALVEAAKRGVKVRLLLPGLTDIMAVREIGMRSYNELLEAGVEIYEWPYPILHAKTMAVDGRWLVVGSANMDSRSFFLNYEAVFAVQDPTLAETAHSQFASDLALARPFTQEDWKARGWRQRLLETLLLPLAGQF
ncbi:MAG: phosphatidylserine/phosphatidylglycerophosphate/cardiolipin synthase family protein [Planctomycetota bacterium]|nr:phosphatidylserine/phosphatidylglycerophosphate/cardiolipin synthase family protein [Planctomycetota bacterium]